MVLQHITHTKKQLLIFWKACLREKRKQKKRTICFFLTVNKFFTKRRNPKLVLLTISCTILNVELYFKITWIKLLSQEIEKYLMSNVIISVDLLKPLGLIIKTMGSIFLIFFIWCFIHLYSLTLTLSFHSIFRLSWASKRLACYRSEIEIISLLVSIFLKNASITLVKQWLSLLVVWSILISLKWSGLVKVELGSKIFDRLDFGLLLSSTFLFIHMISFISLDSSLFLSSPSVIFLSSARLSQ